MNRKWTAADVPDSLSKETEDECFGKETWDEVVAAIANALHVPPPGEPEGECIEVRVAVAVSPTGGWSCEGGSGESNAKHIESCAIEHVQYGEALYWLTARLPIPKPVEVAASVEVQP